MFVVILGVEGPLFFLTLLLFPDGRPPSRRWWPVVWIAIIGGLGQMICAALSDVGFSSNFPRLRDPVTVVAPLTTAYNLAQEAGLVALVAGAAALIVRFRRPNSRSSSRWSRPRWGSRS